MVFFPDLHKTRSAMLCWTKLSYYLYKSWGEQTQRGRFGSTQLHKLAVDFQFVQLFLPA